MEPRPLPPTSKLSFSLPQSLPQTNPLNQPEEKAAWQSADVSYKLPTQNGYFGEEALLLLCMENGTPLIARLAPMTILGRLGSEKRDKTVIDLTAYEAREKGVSRIHAVLHRAPGILEIEDMHSRNGTYVNGWHIKPFQRCALHDGDELRLGGLGIRIQFE